MSLIKGVQSLLLGSEMPLPGGLPPGMLPEGVVLRRGRLIPRIGGWLGRMSGPAAAVTLRHTVVVHPDARLTPRLLAHELTHVRQWKEDPLFPLRYTLGSLRYGYRNNPYEREAREVAVSAESTPSPESTL
jgi:hypothetical protein